jgi:hypothetical protein
MQRLAKFIAYNLKCGAPPRPPSTHIYSSVRHCCQIEKYYIYYFQYIDSFPVDELL